MSQINEYFAIDDVITFNVYPAAILGASFTRVKVLAHIDADTAKLFGIDPIALHAAIYPSLPPDDKTTYKKHTDYKYIKIQKPNGDITALGLPWINMESVEVVTSTTARFTVSLDNPSEIDEILALLNANGFHSIQVETL